MISPLIVNRQLKDIGVSNPFFGRPEMDELPKILVAGEVIQHLINGRYSGGFATLCATNLRLLLIDKKVFFLTVEDVRYDMIAELDYGHQFIGATIHVRSFSKDLKFQCFKKQHLRNFTTYIQKKVMEQRQHQAGTDDGHIPIQAFIDEENAELTPNQAISVLPLSPNKWRRASSKQRVANPYVQSPLMTRKRIGRFYPS